MKFALNALPETFINMLQSLVSLRRIEKYLGAAEVKKLEGLGGGGGEWFRHLASRGGSGGSLKGERDEAQSTDRKLTRKEQQLTCLS